MRCSKSIARVRPLMFLALALMMSAVVVGNARQALARNYGGCFQCLGDCQKQADRLRRQCLQHGGLPSDCDAAASAAQSKCIWDNHCQIPCL